MKNKRKKKALTELRGYRADTPFYIKEIKKSQPEPFNERHRLSDEIRWAALYCSLDEFTRVQILKRSLIVNRRELDKFFEHYGIDGNKRQLISLEVN